MITNTLSSSTKDWIEAKRKKTKYSIHVWEELDLERKINKHKRKFKDDFPNLDLNTNELLFYKVDSDIFDFGCNEFDEIDIRVYNNAGTKSKVMKRLKEFIEYLKNSDVNFNEE